MLHLWPNDPDDDDGNALAWLRHPVLIEVAISLGALLAYATFWVGAALLLHELAAPLD
jgi:hypothetical protein